MKNLVQKDKQFRIDVKKFERKRLIFKSIIKTEKKIKGKYKKLKKHLHKVDSMSEL